MAPHSTQTSVQTPAPRRGSRVKPSTPDSRSSASLSPAPQPVSTTSSPSTSPEVEASPSPPVETSTPSSEKGKGVPRDQTPRPPSAPAPPPWLHSTAHSPKHTPPPSPREGAPPSSTSEPLPTVDTPPDANQGQSLPHPTLSNPAPPALAPIESTGNPSLDNAVAELRASPFWVGNPGRLLHNCEWSANGASRTSVLKWKPHAPDRPADCDDEALVGWVGQVSLEGSVLAADGGWKTYFSPDGAPKHKRNVRVIRPPVGRQQLLPSWEDQLRGAQTVVDCGRRDQTGNLTNVKFCFHEKEIGALRSRSPMFQNGGGHSEIDIPFSHYYSTWHFSSPQVRAVLDGVVSQGHSPQVLEAYDENDELIHPNDVEDTLKGAIVCVFTTLEKALFTGNKQPGRRAWQFYANLVKVQILERAPAEPATRKRKFVPTLGSCSKEKRRNTGSSAAFE